MTDETSSALASQIEAIERELAELRALHALVLDHNPNGIAIAQRDGSLRANQAATALLGEVAENQGSDAWAEQYGLFKEDQRTLFPPGELPLARAMTRRETVRDVLVWMRSKAKPAGTWISVTATPLPEGGGVAVFRDVTHERSASDALRSQGEALEERARVNRDLVERLRLSLDDLSTPVLELWDDVLAVPVVGLLDTQRSARMNDRVLEELSRHRARFVILDLTGVELVDTSTADRMLKLAASVRLLGAECVISGIQPAVAQTLVSLGVELDELVTRHNLEHALAWCLRAAKRAEQSTRGGSSSQRELGRPSRADGTSSSGLNRS
jgi:rsbT co-antagonist protein RsbR